MVPSAKLETLMDMTDQTFEKAKGHFVLALDHISKERWTDAERELETSLRLMPNRVSTRTNLCATLVKLKKFREARELIEETQAIDPLNPELNLNQGLLFSEEGRHEEALASYNRAIELKPDYAEAWSNRGVALGDLRRHEEALASYERAIELKPDYAEAWSNRGITLNDLQRHEDALASYDRAIAC